MATLQDYIRALQNQAGTSQYVRFSPDGAVMTIPQAARYLYGQGFPTTRQIASEIAAERNDRAWSAREAARQREMNLTRQRNAMVRNTYLDALNFLTGGISGQYTRDNPTNMQYANVGAVSALNPTLRGVLSRYWPLAALGLAYGAGQYMLNSPTSYSMSGDSRVLMPIDPDYVPTEEGTSEDTDFIGTPTSPAQPTPANPANPAQGEAAQGGGSPNPPSGNNEDPNKKKKSFKEDMKKVGSNVVKVYKNTGKGLAKGAAYTLSFGVPIGLLGWAGYQAFKPKPTRLDTLNNQLKELDMSSQIKLKELELAKKIKDMEQQMEQQNVTDTVGAVGNNNGSEEEESWKNFNR